MARRAQTATAAAAPDTPAPVGTLEQAFDAAWAPQPEALALRARREAVTARQAAARAWTPDPAALELSGRTDRLSRNHGAREFEVGIAVPIRLPGERSRSAALADAESAAVESRGTAARLRVAASVREAWWQWQRARIEVDIARDRLDSTRRIATDVARRTQACELARADRHQAEGAVAAAASGLAQAAACLGMARQPLWALVSGAPVASDASSAAEELPPAAAVGDIDAHAALQELMDRAPVAERTAALAVAAQYGVPASQFGATLQSLVEGECVTRIVEGSRRFALVVRVPESARSVEGLGRILIQSPTGRVPLSRLASIEDGDGPNQISRDDGKRRIRLWLSGQPLSVAAMVGFFTLAGISVRNGILEVSHHVNPTRFEGEAFGRWPARPRRRVPSSGGAPGRPSTRACVRSAPSIGQRGRSSRSAWQSCIDQACPGRTTRRTIRVCRLGGNNPCPGGIDEPVNVPCSRACSRWTGSTLARRRPPDRPGAGSTAPDPRTAQSTGAPHGP